jgi:linoleoyl-CoA desaturase
MHHVIPDVCHIYYLELGNIFSTLAKKYNIKYKSVSYLAMLVSHFTLLWKLGSPSLKSEVIVSRKIKHA